MPVHPGFVGLLLLVLAGCGAHTPFVNETARAQAMADRNSQTGKTVRVVTQSSNEQSQPLATRQGKSVTPAVRSLIGPKDATYARYPFLKEGTVNQRPVVFPKHDPGTAYLVFENGTYRFAAVSDGTKSVLPPHPSALFSSGNKTEPTATSPYTWLASNDGTSKLGFGLGPVFGAQVAGYCTADRCIRERYYLLTYDTKIEERMKSVTPPSWREVMDTKISWKAYLFEPKFARFQSPAPASVSFGRSELRIKKAGGTKNWVTFGLPVSDGDQPSTGTTDEGGTARVYRLTDDAAPLLVGIVREAGGQETWFFAVSTSSPSSGR
ncbi:MAG: hypothetical protein V1495_08070 [Pseudomonadota bacterium]